MKTARGMIREMMMISIIRADVVILVAIGAVMLVLYSKPAREFISSPTADLYEEGYD